MTSNDNFENLPINYPLFEIFYIESMFFYTSSIIESNEKRNKIIDKINYGKIKNEELHYLLDFLPDCFQNIIIQASALRSYFFPLKNKKEFQIRADKLKFYFNVDKSSALYNEELKDIRNAASHLDERLDVYLSKSASFAGEYIPSFIGYKSWLENDGVIKHIFRGYFFDTDEFKILNHIVKITPILEEVYRIHNMLLGMQERDGRFK